MKYYLQIRKDLNAYFMYYCSTCKQVALILSQSWISVHGQELAFLQVCMNSITFLLGNIPYFALSTIEIPIPTVGTQVGPFTKARFHW